MSLPTKVFIVSLVLQKDVGFSNEVYNSNTTLLDQIWNNNIWQVWMYSTLIKFFIIIFVQLQLNNTHKDTYHIYPS